MNKSSSRSHTIFNIELEQFNVIDNSTVTSVFSIVDLAGIEVYLITIELFVTAFF